MQIFISHLSFNTPNILSNPVRPANMGFSPLSLSQFLFSILFLFHFHTTISSSNYSSSSHFCAPDQSLSLLQFKESFSITSSASGRCQHPKTESWKEGTDCCLWDGVTCDMKTGQVTALDLSCSMLYGTLHPNSTLFSLHHLQKLDLSDNDFQSSHISSSFGQFSNLTDLNLNYSVFAGQVPSEISQLSKLVSLDLSGDLNGYLSLEPISFDKLVRNLTQLRELDLSSVDMSLVTPNALMNLSSSLSSLILRSCGLQGEFPSSMRKFKHLQQLDLADNNLKGPIPYDFEQLTELVSLALSGNENDYLSLEPISFDKLVQNLTQLRKLYLSWVNMSLVEPNSLMNMSSSWSSLVFYSCGLQGKFPSSMRKFKHLQQLDLRYNNFTGSIPYDLGQLTELVSIDLSYNDYLSVEPSSFGKIIQNLTKLRELHLGYVNMPLVTPNSLANLSSSLSVLALWGCGLKGKFPDLAGNHFSGQIPSSLRNLVDLHSLYLDNCNFSGRIPDFLGNLTLLENLGLSSNQLVGPIPSQISTRSLKLFNLGNNHLHGPIPSSIFKQENLEALALASNNKLTGEISSSICKLKFLRLLDLSNNNLSGFIPQCLGNFSNSLSILNLGMNNLQGTIFSPFSKGNNLGYLNLNGNELEGKIPLSIINCTMLEILDLGNNKIEDTFPYFLEMLPELHVLVLKSNKLQGFVNGPIANNSFSKLRIFDISSNNLSGSLPTGYFNSLEAMMISDQNSFYMMARNYSDYAYSIKVTWKGFDIEFARIQSALRILDFSNNNFIGEISKVIGKLKALQQLNLSHNSLTGHIQSSLGMLTYLESLDLSSNLLTGRIPVQLADLTFLGVLNLSHNHLEGPMPIGKQFNTFNASSFEGNLGLCGFPMPKECNSDEAPPSQPSNFHDGDDSKFFGEGFGWKAVAIGYGCGFVFGVTMGYVVFRTRKPAWFLKVVEDQWNLKARRTKKNARRNGARRN
ncbi:receptor-like protein 9DC3 isoform X2 [Populus nigra]|uniref:receptor-like protein 9DC3 isoform X2 n=1 Tax=Populus nigra TaxID=3691 RepID=UPI002B275DB7|nr:receptor-like protein 9DC3 isoform X2 [Populus nigra]